MRAFELRLFVFLLEAAVFRFYDASFGLEAPLDEEIRSLGIARKSYIFFF